ncbi:YciI family protein [Dactylosporangium fulvum]|uniref:YciI family protein n=1 Tax=Dactylosporangium fulvum TaxID=53359 RepID=A0ABY5W4K3_9ACTN|nr:YciI family protein [Dactylosporangium fulvum]UWP84910.1 YciI family protein [Dactylosporangium fulvum]
MKYLIMIYGNPASRAVWETFSPAEQAEGWARHAELRDAMVASGELVHSEALAPPETAKVLTARAGRPQVTDGPFAEVKEHLAGFYLVDCDSLDRALELAAGIPEAPHVTIEVRPVVDLG